MLFFNFFWVLFPYVAYSDTAFQYCDDCLLSCCNLSNTCASSTKYCYCSEKLCKNNCCIDNRCGTADECEDSKVKVIIISVTAIVCAIFCILLILFIIKVRKFNRVRVVNMNNDPIVFNPVNRASQRSDPPPINHVYIGTPLKFEEYGKEALPGAIPVMMGLKVDKKNKRSQIL
jgi:hypothetical protein